MDGQPVKIVDLDDNKTPPAMVRFLSEFDPASRTSATNQNSFNSRNPLFPFCLAEPTSLTFLALADDRREDSRKQGLEIANAFNANAQEEFKGSIFLIGGRAQKCFDEAVKLAGDKPKIAVVGLASGTDDERRHNRVHPDEDLAEDFVNHGIKSGDITIITSKGVVPKNHKFKYSYELPADTTLVYFGGGAQDKLRKRFDDHQLDSVKKLLKEGANIAGNSAGTAVMSTEMIADGEVKNLKHAPGFGLIPWAIMDTHVDSRPIRINRGVKAFYDIGDRKIPVIGLDEDTSLRIRWQDSAKNLAGGGAPEGGGLKLQRTLTGEIGGFGRAHVIDEKTSRLLFNRAITPRLSTDGLDKREAYVFELNAKDTFEVPKEVLAAKEDAI